LAPPVLFDDEVAARQPGDRLAAGVTNGCIHFHQVDARCKLSRR
jgi:hypothetical protein